MKTRLAKKIYYAYLAKNQRSYWAHRWRQYNFCMVCNHRIEKAIRKVNKTLKEEKSCVELKSK